MKFKYLILMLNLCLCLSLSGQESSNEFITYSLSKSDNATETSQFLKVFQEFGLKVANVNTKRSSGNISRINFALFHEAGLSYKMDIRGFAHLEVSFLLDDEGKAEAFAFRFNEKGDFDNWISVNQKGKGVFKYKSNGSNCTNVIYSETIN